VSVHLILPGVVLHAAANALPLISRPPFSCLALQLLGSCTLAQLRDAIRCPSDVLAASAAVAAPSSYFYIGGRFFADGRPPAVSSTGTQIAAFCRSAGVAAPLHLLPAGGGSGGCGGDEAAAAVPGGQEQGLQQHQQEQRQDANGAAAAAAHAAADKASAGELPSAHMENVRFVDLVLTVANRPTYLYCHAGCCEHGWFVSDVRLRHARDPPPPQAAQASAEGGSAKGTSGSAGGDAGGGGPAAAPAAYPRVVFRAPPSPRWRCGVCGRAGVVAVVAGHPAAPEDPCMLCPGCRELLLPPPCGEAPSGGGGGGGGGAAAWRVYTLV
jgi:hypothetical protein